MTDGAEPGAARTFSQLLRAVAAAFGDAPAVIRIDEDGGEETLSFTALEARSATLARGLIARGVGKGSRIGFVFGNGPEFAVVLAAIARIGAIAVPVSTLIKANELVRVLRQSDVAGLIVQRRFLGRDYVERAAEALPGLRAATAGALRLAEAPYLRWIASTGGALPAAVDDLARIEAAGADIDDALLAAIEAEVHPTDQMIEIYTSGAMALPKGVKHDHGPVLFRAHYLRGMLDPQPGARIAAILPMFWVGGLMMYLLPNLAAGATTVCTDRTLSSSRHAMGSVMAADDLAAMPKPKVVWALGMTETLGPFSYADEVRVPGYPLCAPLDHIADRYDVRVVGGDGMPVADGGRGELQVRGYALTPGLHKVARAGYFTADGYYRTGDLCEVHGGRILFVGRDGDVIKTASANVSPAEVEEELQRLPGVHSAYVVGLPDTERGQLVVAGVVPREGETVDGEALIAALGTRLSGFKVPRAIVVLARDEVPMLHSNKVARREVERLLAERLGRVPPSA